MYLLTKYLFLYSVVLFLFFSARGETIRAEAEQACQEMIKKVGRSLYQIKLIHGECYMKKFVHCNCKIPLCVIFDLSNLWNKRSSLRLDLSNLWKKQNSLRFNLSKVQNKQGSLRFDLHNFWNKQVASPTNFLIILDNANILLETVKKRFVSLRYRKKSQD